MLQRRVERVFEKAGGTLLPLLHETDGHELGMLLNPQRVAVHFQPQEFRPGRQRVAPGGLEKGVDIVDDGAGVAVGQEHVADEPPGPLEFVKGAGMKLIGQDAALGMFFHIGTAFHA